MSPFAWQREHADELTTPLRRGPSLALRLSIPVALLVVAVFAIHLYFNDPQELVLAQKRAEAARLGSITQAILHREMLAGLPGNVQEHLDPLQESGGVERILVIDPSGVVRFGNDADEIGRTMLPEFHPECLICTAEDGETVEPQLMLRTVGGHRVFTYAFLVENEAECRSCHPFPEKYLGQVLLDLPLTSADRELLRAGHRVAASAGLLLVLAIAGIFLISRVLVQRPIRALLEATHAIESGNFAPAFPKPRGDELGLLSAAFQRMAARLGQLVTHQEREISRRTADLERSHQALLRQEKLAALGRMTAGVAHEIGNPMGAISAMSEVIEHATDPSEIRRECVEIRDQVDRVSRLVRDLTDSARPFTRGSQADLGESVRSAHRVVILDHRDAKRVDFALDDRLDGEVVGLPREHLIQVFVNLFANAVEALADADRIAEGQVRVEVVEHSPALVVRVSDNGPGIEEAHAAHLFEPFFTTKGATKGTGLGLWVCYTVLDRWGGHIELGDHRHGGAEFFLRFPLAVKGEDGDDDAPSDRR